MTQLGKYDIIEEIGRGGFGVVYKAHDRSLERTVAIKVLHPQLTVDPRFVENFNREARNLARINHPKVVTVHEIGEVDGRLFIAMEYLPGGSLADRLKRDGPLSINEALKIIAEAGAGLAAGHKKEIIHRDIKPGNILFNEDGQAVIGDFGVARAVQLSCLGTTTESGGTVGTPFYRPPELWRGSPPPSPATDVYSLACVLYEMLTGEVLFSGDTPDMVLTQHILEDVESLMVNAAERFPEHFQSVLVKALAKDPQVRFQATDSFLKALNPVHQVPLTKKGAAETPVVEKMTVQDDQLDENPETGTTLKVEQPLIPDETPEELPAVNSKTHNIENGKAQPESLPTVISEVETLEKLGARPNIGTHFGGPKSTEKADPPRLHTNPKPEKKKTGLIFGLSGIGLGVVSILVLIILIFCVLPVLPLVMFPTNLPSASQLTNPDTTSTPVVGSAQIVDTQFTPTVSAQATEIAHLTETAKADMGLGDLVKFNEGGFILHVISDYEIEEGFGMVMMTAPGADPDVGPVVYAGGYLVDEVISAQEILDEIKKDAEDSNYSPERRYTIDGIEGLLVNYSGVVKNQDIQGKMFFATPRPFQQFFIYARASEDDWLEFEPLFDAMLDSVNFIDAQPLDFDFEDD